LHVFLKTNLTDTDRPAYEENPLSFDLVRAGISIAPDRELVATGSPAEGLAYVKAFDIQDGYDPGTWTIELSALQIGRSANVLKEKASAPNDATERLKPAVFDDLVIICEYSI
jgi:hypothetical protein